MSETFGQRLSRIRKEKGLTQEDIAKRIIISPQAVSKWENDLSSPDILVLSSLADILGVSVDTLLGREETTHAEEEKQEEASEVVDDDKKFQSDEEVHVNDDEGKSVNINNSGIHITDGKGNSIDINKKGVYKTENGEETKVDLKKKFKRQRVYIITSSTFTGLALVAFFLLGIFWTDQNMGWKMGWISFLYAIVLSSIPYAIRKRKFTRFNYPILATSAYLTLGFLGMYLGFPGFSVYWFLFITIPAYYMIFGPIDKFIHRNDPEDDDDDEDDEDDD